MAFDFPVYGTGVIPLTTAASGTYGYLVPPMLNAWTGIMAITYTTGATVESLYVCRPIGLTHLTAAAAAAQAVVVLNGDPGLFSGALTKAGQPFVAFTTADDAMAASDYVAYQCLDGTWRFDTVASLAPVTLTTNLPAGGLPAGAPLWFFGLPTETNPYDAQVQPAFSMFVSVAKGAGLIGNFAASVPFVQSYSQNSPLLILATSTTNQSYIESGSVVYLQRPSNLAPSGNPLAGVNTGIPYPNG